MGLLSFYQLQDLLETVIILIKENAFITGQKIKEKKTAMLIFYMETKLDWIIILHLTIPLI